MVLSLLLLSSESSVKENLIEKTTTTTTTTTTTKQKLMQPWCTTMVFMKASQLRQSCISLLTYVLIADRSKNHQVSEKNTWAKHVGQSLIFITFQAADLGVVKTKQSTFLYKSKLIVETTSLQLAQNTPSWMFARVLHMPLRS